MRVRRRVAQVVIPLVLHADEDVRGCRAGDGVGSAQDVAVEPALDAVLHVAALQIVPQQTPAPEVVELGRGQLQRILQVLLLARALSVARAAGQLGRDAAKRAVEVWSRHVVLASVAFQPAWLQVAAQRRAS